MNKSGLGLIEVLVSIAIMGVFILTTQKALEYAQKTQAGSQLSFDLMLGRNNLLTVLSQSDVWTNTIDNNVNMNCLKTATACTAGTYDFDVYEWNQDTSAVTAYYAWTTGTAKGLTKDGTECASFTTSTPGDPACPMRAELKWTPICPTSGACVNPNVRITATFTVNSAEVASQINLNRMNFELIQ